MANSTVKFFLFTLLFLCQSFYFFSLTWAMVGHFLVLLLLSVLRHCGGFLQIKLGPLGHFYTADLCHILLLDHNDSFSKYDKNVAD